MPHGTSTYRRFGTGTVYDNRLWLSEEAHDKSYFRSFIDRFVEKN
jgi:hypothetical protein